MVQNIAESFSFYRYRSADKRSVESLKHPGAATPEEHSHVYYNKTYHDATRRTAVKPPKRLQTDRTSHQRSRPPLDCPRSPHGALRIFKGRKARCHRLAEALLFVGRAEAPGFFVTRTAWNGAERKDWGDPLKAEEPFSACRDW